MKKIFKNIFNLIWEFYILFVFIMASIFAYAFPKICFMALIVTFLILSLDKIINKFFNKEK